MKGTIFLKPLEYNIEAVGEKWRQGDKIKGTLAIKNHSAEKLELPHLVVALCEGNYKKIKAKDKNAWKLLANAKLEEHISLNGPIEKNCPFEFTLPQDCPVTDKGGSIYLAFFDQGDTWPAGHIELVIGPKQVISQILEIFENFLRFKVVQIKSVKGMVEVKLSPPSSRELSTIDSLVLSISEIDKNLTMNYLFNMRVLDMAGASLQAQKKTKEMEQKFSSKQYLIYGESLNQEFVLESINSVINEVKPKFL
ncbi:MAG: hypothetical protein ACXVCE_18030 [Bacteriovorax sp.]